MFLGEDSKTISEIFERLKSSEKKLEHIEKHFAIIKLRLMIQEKKKLGLDPQPKDLEQIESAFPGIPIPPSLFSSSQ